MRVVHTGRLLSSATAAIPLALLFLAFSVQPKGGGTETSSDDKPNGRQLSESACAACHGSDGRGQSVDQVGFDVALPDFTDCSFASREPAADWVAVAHEGGPVRAFSHLMPAFGDALSMEELELIVEYVGTLCTDDSWPRGELNLPRPLFTEKAYPEDEAVITTIVNAEGVGSVANKFVYEKRFGAQNQIELVVPFSFQEQAGADLTPEWNSGLGDVAIGFKRALYHSASSGTIASVTGEVVLPTGDESDGFGKGTTVFEPFLTFGQILPNDMFIQAQGGLELPTNTDRAENEGFWRVLVGKSFTQGLWGRTWSPMVSVLGATELEGGTPNWDVVPQIQITLNKRQHIMANVGVRVPLTDADVRDTQVVVYVLWDWFDGGFLDGW